MTRFATITKKGRHYHASDQNGIDITLEISPQTMKSAFESKTVLQEYTNKKGKIQWRRIKPEVAAMSIRSEIINATHTPLNKNMENISEILSAAPSKKPSNMKVTDLVWRFVVRSVLRGENLLIYGDTGCGKTKLALTVAKFLDRPTEIFNLGATQEARSTLIGNTHLDKERGTYVAPSLFVQMIQTENAVIILDEMSRAHYDATNILMSVLDKEQRYLRIDESPDTPTIKVAKGVTFLATANVGAEFTAARVLDRALEDRFSKIHLEPLDKATEIDLLTELYPNLKADDIRVIASIADETRKAVKAENPSIDTIISTRATIEMAALIADGFSLLDACELKVYPFFSDAGGTSSPRGAIKQIVQKHISDSGKDTPFENDGEFEDEEEPIDPFTP